MKRSQVILKTTTTTYLHQVVVVLTFLFLTPYTAHRMGTDQFGLWSLMWAVVTLLALMDLGLSNAVVRFISEYRGKQESVEDVADLKRLVSTFFWTQVLMSLLLFALAVACAWVVATLLSVPAEYVAQARTVLILLAFRAAVGMPMALFAGLLTSHDKLSTVNWVRIFGSILYAVSVVVVFQWNTNVVALAITNVATYVVQNFLMIAAACRAVPYLSLALGLFDRKRLRRIASFSIFAFLVQVSTLLQTRVDLLIVQYAITLAAVAQYSVAIQVVTRASQFCRPLLNALTPAIARLGGEGDSVAIRTTVRKGTKIAFAISVPLLGGLALLSSDLIWTWMGAKFIEGIVPLQILSIAILVSMLFATVSHVLMLTDNQRFAASTAFGGQVINLVLSIILVQTPLALSGVALATLISSVLTAFWVIEGGHRRLGFPRSDIYVRALLPSVVPGVIMTLAVLAARQSWVGLSGSAPDSLIVVAILEAWACIVFYVSFWLLGFNSKERAYFAERFGGVFKRKSTGHEAAN